MPSIPGSIPAAHPWDEANSGLYNLVEFEMDSKIGPWSRVEAVFSIVSHDPYSPESVMIQGMLGPKCSTVHRHLEVQLCCFLALKFLKLQSLKRASVSTQLFLAFYNLCSFTTSILLQPVLFYNLYSFTTSALL